MSVMNEDGTRNFWRENEVHFLLKLIKKHNLLQKSSGKKYGKTRVAEVFKKIEQDFKKEGFNRTDVQIRCKFKALKSSYNQAVKESLLNGNETPSCDFYEELDDLFKSHSLLSNETLDSGHEELLVKKENDHPADLVEILLREDASEEEVEMVYYVQKPIQSELSETSIGNACSSGLKRPETSEGGPSKKKRKELDGDSLLDRFLDYQKKADERAARLFREAEERAQDRADARMRESMAILSSTISSIFEKFQVCPNNTPYSTTIPPSSVTFTFNPQGNISSSSYTPPSDTPSPVSNMNFQCPPHNSTTISSHHIDHPYSPKS